MIFKYDMPPMKHHVVDKWFVHSGLSAAYIFAAVAETRCVLVDDAIKEDAALLEVGKALCGQLGIKGADEAMTKDEYKRWINREMYEADAECKAMKEEEEEEDTSSGIEYEFCEIRLAAETRELMMRVMSPELRGVFYFIYHAI
jgi:hypothetical protein